MQRQTIPQQYERSTREFKSSRYEWKCFLQVETSKRRFDCKTLQTQANTFFFLTNYKHENKTSCSTLM